MIGEISNEPKFGKKRLILFKNLISGILVLVEKRFKIGDWILVEGIIEGIVE